MRIFKIIQIIIEFKFGVDSFKFVKLSLDVSSVEHRTKFVHFKFIYVAEYLKSTYRLIEAKSLTIEIHLDFHLLFPSFSNETMKLLAVVICNLQAIRIHKRLENLQCALSIYVSIICNHQICPKSSLVEYLEHCNISMNQIWFEYLS